MRRVVKFTCTGLVIFAGLPMYMTAQAVRVGVEELRKRRFEASTG